MKISTWVPKKQPLQRTLADVPSSRENPVLCWVNSQDIRPMFNHKEYAAYVTESGKVETLTCGPSVYKLYHKPSIPARLEEVPDRRIVSVIPLNAIEAGHAVPSLVFRLGAVLFELDGTLFRGGLIGKDNWQLTDHCVELVETEIGVVE